jgi:5'-nucleotidase
MIRGHSGYRHVFVFDHRPPRWWRQLVLAVVAVVAQPVAAEARNILIANDDGLTSNVRALHDALKASGHDVVVVVPCQQQSGMGGALYAMKPLGPLASDCLNAAARAGDPGAGPMTRPDVGADFHYVDGTPVMAMLYGLDVVGKARWNGPPDLVISGPNIGRNVGGIVVSSGTVSNVQYALIRGIPAIALSAGTDTESGPDLVNPQSAVVASRVIELIEHLEQTARSGPLLPAGTALNVNFPDGPALAKWKMARIGTSMAYGVEFVPDLKAVREPGETPLPGLLFRVLDEDGGSRQATDEALIARSHIAISVMQLAYDAPAGMRLRATKRFQRLLAP